MFSNCINKLLRVNEYWHWKSQTIERKAWDKRKKTANRTLINLPASRKLFCNAAKTEILPKTDYRVKIAGRYTRGHLREFANSCPNNKWISYYGKALLSLQALLVSPTPLPFHIPQANRCIWREKYLIASVGRVWKKRGEGAYFRLHDYVEMTETIGYFSFCWMQYR